MDLDTHIRDVVNVVEYEQSVKLRGTPVGVIDPTYVFLSGWEGSPTRIIYDRLQSEPGWDIRVWDVGHDVAGEATDRPVDLLTDVASRAEAASQDSA